MTPDDARRLRPFVRRLAHQHAKYGQEPEELESVAWLAIVAWWPKLKETESDHHRELVLYRRVAGAMRDHMRSQDFVAKAARSLKRRKQRHATAEPTAPLPLKDSDVDQLVSRAELASVTLERAQVCRRVQEALATLPTRLQTVVVRVFEDEQTLAEAGAELGVSESRASQLKSAAFAQLREQLTDLAA